MALTMAEVARDYETDGVPSSGPHKIKKNNLRGWGAWVEGIISAFVNVNGGLIFASKASLDASLNYNANQMAWVLGDATVANNGVYRKIGGSGSGSWTRVSDLPFSFIIASDAGVGTANAIQATTSIPVASSALVWMSVFEANTASPVTVSFNGGTALTVKTNTGNNVAVGGLVAGMIVLGIVSGSTFRLVSDQASSAIVAAAEAAQAAAEDAAVTATQVAIAPSGLVADYDIESETGTDNSASILTALATGKSVHIPPGNYYVNDSDIDRALENGRFVGPGRIFSGWLTGRDEEQGKMHALGICSPLRGEVGAGGILLGGEGVNNTGMGVWASARSGWAARPKDPSYHEFNLYPHLPIGMGEGQSGTSNILFTYGNFDGFTDLIEVGDYIGFGLFRYKISALITGGFSVNTVGGVPVNFPTDTERTYRWAYDVRRGICNVSGTTVTFVDGEAFWTFLYGDNKNRIKINGTWYEVTAIAGPRQLTIASSPGTLNGAAFIQKTHVGFTTGFRIQSMFGGREENAFMGILDTGELDFDLQGFVGAGVPREMPLTISAADSFDDRDSRTHIVMSADGRFGLGEDRDTVIASPARFSSAMRSNVAHGGAATTLVVGRFRSFFNGDLRYADFYFANNFEGLNIQSRTGSGVAKMAINPEGGNVAVGAPASSANEALFVGGAVRVTGASQGFNNSDSGLYDYHNGNARLVASRVAGAGNHAGLEFWTTLAGVTSLAASFSKEGFFVPKSGPYADNAAAAAAGVPVGGVYRRTSDNVLLVRV